jgi:hypothetical protein
MPNYQQSIIYKICCKDLEIQDIYIGSTTNFKQRKYRHKSNLNKGKNYNIYNFIRDNGGWDNWEMVLIKEFKCNTKLELFSEERKTIEEFNPTLNSILPNRNCKERKQTEKYKIKDREYKKVYNKIKVECECGVLISQNHLSRHRRTEKHKKNININYNV